MKKFFAIAILLVGGIFASQNAHSQVRQNVVKLNPLSLGAATFNVSYERVLNDSKSVQLGVYYTGLSFGDISYSGLGVTPEFRMYFGGAAAPEGWHITPFARFSTYSLEATIEGEFSSASMTGFGGGVLIGRQWLFGKSDRISMDMFIGPKYDVSSYEVEGSADEDDFSVGALDGFWIRGGITFGVAF